MNTETVRELARALHAGQTDKNGAPYSDHVEAVAAALAPLGPVLEMAGLLHDTIEDTGETADTLLARGIPEEVVRIVEAVTRRDGEDYQNKICAIARDPHACLVKIADNAHNTRPDRFALLAPRQKRRLSSRYREARETLWMNAPAEDIRTIVSLANPSLLEHLA